MLRIIETPAFARKLSAFLDDREYAKLQFLLAIEPEAGVLIPGSGGIRKIRWAARGRGKSGGVRVIYYHLASDGAVYMLYIYGKGDQGNLSARQIASLRDLIANLSG